ncbi:tRNA uracil 4-sulfurtransferase ThiI [Spirochaeta cellobiosiphila]|uniref:tRNA uracil 4-sulfurtransferase ThiI n=1 Tax=Spirochaeta cellobiosiphila TaxID=504483 RepID=UPI0003F7EFC8|nr:tRNA uracil 4-sulfurtransferase ThiI [Spirochaeta cellobiosiphila]
MDTYLLKIGELSLKGRNKNFFEKTLVKNIKRSLKEVNASVEQRSGRVYVRTKDVPREFMEDRLSKVCGIVGFSHAQEVEKDIDSIIAAGITKAREYSDKPFTFKVESRRTDKSFPMGSYDISREVGGAMDDALPHAMVRMKNPDFVLTVEVREKAYVYGNPLKAPGGLPVGTSGRAVLLLSGGIDSPVAGYQMIRRGLRIDAIYFTTPPYTSEESTQKVKDLAAKLAPWNGGINLFIVPFTPIQLHIRKKAPLSETTLHTRAAMTQIAERLAISREAGALITGESLGQVASQTIESLRFTNSAPNLPILRPLIGTDKEEIIKTSRFLDAYDISILPYEDCCSLFSPSNPVTRPVFQEIRTHFDALELDPLYDEVMDKIERVNFKG